MESVICAETISRNEKVCVDCNASKTPLWRSGPAGLKSLCNACGIRYRKKRSMIGSDKRKEKLLTSPTSSTKREELRIQLVAVGKEVVLLRRKRTPTKVVKRQRVEKFGEVEEAAFVLMSLSCGVVFG